MAGVAKGQGVMPGDESTRLALDRTRLAHERTLMAWVRTAMSLISFGFTIYKFFQYMRENAPAGARPQLLGPRGYALIVIGLGVGALVAAAIEQRHQMRALQTAHPEYGPMSGSPAATVAWVVSTLGVAMFLLVVFRQ
jgi:putative membrane protein